MSAVGAFAAGDNLYPMSSARCRTCRSAHRHDVERLVLTGTSYTAAARDLPDDAGLSHKNIREHVRRGHVQVEQEVVRRLIEVAGGDHAAVLELGVTEAVRRLAEATEVLQGAWCGVAAGSSCPTFKEGLKAAQLLQDYDEAVRRDRGLEVQLGAAHEALWSVLTEVKTMLSERAWSRLLAQMDKDPQLRPYVPSYGDTATVARVVDLEARRER